MSASAQTTPQIVHDFTHIQPFIKGYKGRLSEGLTYNKHNNTLLWVDIIAGEVHRATLHGDKHTRSYSNHETFKIPNESIGVIHLTTDPDVVLLGGRIGIASYRFSSGEFNYLWTFDGNPEIIASSSFENEPCQSSYKLRCNDGNIDPNGNIWQGLMFDFPYEPHHQGKLLKIDPLTGKISVEVKDILVPNGINWSKDGKFMYWTSTRDDIIYKFPYDLQTGEINTSEKQVHIRTSPSYLNQPCEGPDGHALTEEEHIFTATWGGSSVAHFDQGGLLVEKFMLPALNITDVLFVEENEMFVCCANKLPEDETLTDESLGGSVFRIVVEGGNHRGVERPYLRFRLVKS
ncbi:hypothetical protein WICPIJ_009940 [Wickerhamomyces pijperi]|uniref:SMP-30/Gluconolactonase/LRE-like region domain-containing protein n=1 Tax=Wickerhamomyces pijperi TaxID=599730 RepID=A0A9P8TBH9_WICPI|nr:hypothetical protein WICPIJ_009940 [Wickerhamomyces pijperi]